MLLCTLSNSKNFFGLDLCSYFSLIRLKIYLYNNQKKKESPNSQIYIFINAMYAFSVYCLAVSVGGSFFFFVLNVCQFSPLGYTTNKHPSSIPFGTLGSHTHEIYTFFAHKNTEMMIGCTQRAKKIYVAAYTTILMEKGTHLCWFFFTSHICVYLRWFFIYLIVDCFMFHSHAETKCMTYPFVLQSKEIKMIPEKWQKKNKWRHLKRTHEIFKRERFHGSQKWLGSIVNYTYIYITHGSFIHEWILTKKNTWATLSRFNVSICSVYLDKFMNDLFYYTFYI